MALGSPISDTGRAIRNITFRHATIGTDFYSSARFSDFNQDVSEEDLDTIAQAFIDMINNSADFEVGFGSKEYSTAQELTPTPTP